MRLHSASSWLLALLCTRCAAQLTDVPSPENFYRRSSMSATVIGNYVYIDGGELSQAVNGKSPDQQNYSSNSVNSTISIDLSKSWTTSNVVLRTIDRPWYSKSNQAIWTNREEGYFYVWGGKWVRGRNMTDNMLWKFTPDGSGGGKWSVENATNDQFFADLHQNENSVFTNTNDTGFSIGGIASGWTEHYRASNQVISGMVAYNMKTKIWQNGTTAFSPFDTLSGGRAEYLPNYGPNGLVIVLGGTAHRVDADPDEKTARPFDFQNLTLFDPQTKKQYWQVATGAIPPSPRIAFCTATLQNNEGGYEILLFGGANERDMFTYDDAYILSLPGFVWTKVATSPGGQRRSLACVPVGKRQVLAIGGTGHGGWTEKDTVPQGLLLFDMTELKWKEEYDPNAAAYERAGELKTWYNNGSYDAVQWSSNDVRQFFGAKSTNSSSSPSQTSDSSKTTSSSDSTPASNPTPVGAIAGGVVGGVAGIAIIAAVAWFLIRRRKNTDAAPVPGNDDHNGYYSAEHAQMARPAAPVQELNFKMGPMELRSERDHGELMGSTTYTHPFLNHHVAAVEMDATPIR